MGKEVESEGGENAFEIETYIISFENPEEWVLVPS